MFVLDWPLKRPFFFPGVSQPHPNRPRASDGLAGCLATRVPVEREGLRPLAPVPLPVTASVLFITHSSVD
jgi:hypothetical protein